MLSAFENRTIEKILIEVQNNILNQTNNEDKMGLKEFKKKLNDYKDEFPEKARLLQSIWRTEKGFEFEKYGNFLKEDFAKQNGANFLSETIFEIVKNEIETKHEKEKVIQEPRTWNNLLSSQPLAFNMLVN